MATWLPYRSYHFVMDELHQALQEILVSNFRYLRKLNPDGGIQKLLLNVATLEQILSLISNTVPEAANLHRTRQFYHLAAAGPDHLIEVAPGLSERFTSQQYQSIFDVYYRDLSGSAGEDLRKTYNNQLVRLKYLLDDGTSSLNSDRPGADNRSGELQISN